MQHLRGSQWLQRLPHCKCKVPESSASADLTERGAAREASFELSRGYFIYKLCKYMKDHFHYWRLCFELSENSDVAEFTLAPFFCCCCSFIKQTAWRYYTGSLSYIVLMASQDGCIAEENKSNLSSCVCGKKKVENCFKIYIKSRSLSSDDLNSCYTHFQNLQNLNITSTLITIGIGGNCWSLTKCHWMESIRKRIYFFLISQRSMYFIMRIAA